MLNRFQRRLIELEKQHLIRYRVPVEKTQSGIIRVQQSDKIDFSSSDYLSLSQHPDVKHELHAAVQKHGSGSGASPVVSGYCMHTRFLEDELADFLNRDQALFFNSGYHANMGLLQSLADRHTCIFLDKQCHASIVDGVLLSRAHHVRFHHLDYDHLEQLLKRCAKKNKIIISESIFSMHGQLTDVNTLSALAKQYDALLIIDDAHGFGILGEHGGGIAEYGAFTQFDLPVISLPMGKAAASMGAVLCGHATYINTIEQHARSYRYSTALPGYVIQTLLRTIKLIQVSGDARKKLFDLAFFFNESCQKMNVPVLSLDATPIRIIPIGSAERVLWMREKIMEAGFFVSAIRPPTVSLHHSCLRISLNAAHTKQNIQTLLQCIRDLL